MKEPKSILVTGCSGYVGQHLLERLLQHNYLVYGIDHTPIVDVQPHHFVLGDFTTKIACKEPDVVVHLAATKSIEYSVHNPVLCYQNNVAKTIELLANYPHAKIIFASSVSVYGNTPKTVDENSPINPQNPYAHSKAMVEQILRDRGNAISLRFANIYGNNMQTSQEHSVYRDKSNSRFMRFKGAVRTFVHIDLVVNAIMTCIEDLIAVPMMNVVEEIRKIKDIAPDAPVIDCPEWYVKKLKIKSLLY